MPGHSSQESFTCDGWRGVVASDWRDVFAHVEEWLSQNQITPVPQGKNRVIRRVETPQGAVYAKVLVTLVDGRHPLLDVFKRIKWYIRPSRSLATLRISNAMLDAGVPCAEVILAARKRNAWGWPSDLIIMRAVEAPSLLKLWKTAETPEMALALLTRATADLVSIHNRGFVHGDCIPGNLFWDGENIHYIDNDRTHHLSGFRLRRGRIKNLISLCTYFCGATRRMDETDAILAAYSDAMAATRPEEHFERLLPKIRKKILARIQGRVERRRRRASARAKEK